MIAGLALATFGVIFGAISWWRSALTDIPATTGTVMIATLPIILGFQLLLSFVNYDIANEPKVPLQRLVVSSDEPIPRRKMASDPQSEADIGG